MQLEISSPVVERVCSYGDRNIFPFISVPVVLAYYGIEADKVGSKYYFDASEIFGVPREWAVAIDEDDLCLSFDGYHDGDIVRLVMAIEGEGDFVRLIENINMLCSGTQIGRPDWSKEDLDVCIGRARACSSFEV